MTILSTLCCASLSFLSQCSSEPRPAFVAEDGFVQLDLTPFEAPYDLL